MGTDIRNYAFIDGNYLRCAYERTLRKLFPNAHHTNLDFATIKNELGASKVFYYDAVDEEAKDAAERRTFLEHLQGLDGFHVREGSVSRSKTKKKRTQKRVDVQLAVDCLMHAYHKNIWHVNLIAGDLDFEPLVAALVDLGIHVHVFYESTSAARRLCRAADAAEPIDFVRFYRWSSKGFRRAHRIPEPVTGTCPPSMIEVRRGTWKGSTVVLLRDVSDRQFAIESRGVKAAHRYSDTNIEHLVKFFEAAHGEIQWESDSVSDNKLGAV